MSGGETMKGGGGGSDGNMTKSWCSNCQRISTLMLATPTLHPSSSSSSSPSRRRVNSLLKVAMSLATVVLLFSVYQSCAPTESSLPVWLSLSFVSRPSFILSSAELSQQPQQRPASRLVETLGSIPLESNLSTLPSAGASFSSGTGHSEDQTGDEKPVERGSFEIQIGSLIDLQRASDLSDSDSSAAEKDLAQDPLQSSLHGSNTSDANLSSVEKDVLVDPVEDFERVSNSSDSSDVEKDEFEASETAVVAETSSMEGANSNFSASSAEQDVPKENEIMLPSETASMERVNSHPSDSHPSPSSTVEKDEPKESETVFLSGTTSMERVISNLSDSVTPSSSSVEKDEVKESGTTVIAETTSTESAKNDGFDGGKISEHSGLEKEQLGGAVSSNWSQETAPEKDATIRNQETISQTDATLPSENGAPHQDAVIGLGPAPAAQSTEPEFSQAAPEKDAAIRNQETISQTDVTIPSENGAPHQDVVIGLGPAPAAQSTDPELSQAALAQPPADTQLATPSHIAENPRNERRVRLEEQLHAAKQAIEVATLADADPSLYGVIYHNVSTFTKSYKLMEEIFKIYVYADGKPPLVHTGPLLGIYASEGRFIDQISRGSSFIVEDPELAHMYYLPYSVTQMTLTIYVEGSHSMQPLNTFIKDYVDQVAATYPFWNRTGGADHFFVSCHDWGPATARDHEELRKNAMKVVCNADVNEEFVLGKDASLPEIYLHNHKRAKVGGPGAIRRSFLAFFAGQMHGHVRPMLIEHWKDKDPDMKIYEVLPKSIERKMNYVEHMKNSKYCICAAGFEVNSPRIVESIYYDCVPVIIADNFVLPFSDVLNWSTFSVTLPESEIPNLKSILSSISDRQYRAMQKRLSKVRQHLLWNDEPVKYDVFHMIMHSVWMSRLNRLKL